MPGTGDIRPRRESDQTSQAESNKFNFDYLRELANTRASQRPPETPHQGYFNPLTGEVFSQGQVRDHVAEQQDQISLSGFPDIAETASNITRTTDSRQKRLLEEDQATTSDISHKKVKLDEKVDVDQAEEILNGIESTIKQIISDYKDIPQQQRAAACKEIYDKWSYFAPELAAIVRRKIARREEYLNDFKELKKDKMILKQTQRILEEEETNSSVSPGYYNTHSLREKEHILQENIKRLDTKLHEKNENDIMQRVYELQMLLERREDKAAILNETYKKFLSLQERQNPSMEDADSASPLDSSQDPVAQTDVPASSKGKERDNPQKTIILDEQMLDSYNEEKFGTRDEIRQIRKDDINIALASQLDIGQERRDSIVEFRESLPTRKGRGVGTKDKKVNSENSVIEWKKRAVQSETKKDTVMIAVMEAIIYRVRARNAINLGSTFQTETAFQTGGSTFQTGGSTFQTETAFQTGGSTFQTGGSTFQTETAFQTGGSTFQTGGSTFQTDFIHYEPDRTKAD